jgi:hypothetical protein
MDDESGTAGDVALASPLRSESRSGLCPSGEVAPLEVAGASSTAADNVESAEATVADNKEEVIAGSAVGESGGGETTADQARSSTPEVLTVADTQQQAGSLKGETTGEDLAEDFSDFGDSDEDILNQVTFS